VDDVSVALEHVDLLNGLDGLYVKLLQRGLELLVVGTGALVDLLDLPAGSALASAHPISLMPPVSNIAIVCPPLSFTGRCGGSRLGRVFGAGLSKRKRGLLTLFAHVSNCLQMT
jgi:hypothetical protein